MKTVLLTAFQFILVYSLSAQSYKVTGRVTDVETGDPLRNATIWVSGTQGTITDKDGNFEITCNGTVKLVISYIGYETYNKQVDRGAYLEISLSQLSKNLNAVELAFTADPNKKLLYQPMSIAKLSDVELNRGTGILMDDAININIPGVMMERRTFSAGQQFNLRGYGNGANGTSNISSNFDGQGYKVYLNGIPVTSAEGITVMDDIDYGSIGNVEVLKGPSGTLYGQAISGVVNMKTKRAEPGKASIGQNVMFGSYGMQRYTTHVEIGKERASFMVNYGKQLFSGFMPHTRSRKDFVNMIGEFTPGLNQTINAYFGFSYSYDERNGELSQTQWDNNDFSGNAKYIKNNAHSNVITVRAGVGHTYRFGNSVSNTTSLFGTGSFTNASSSGGGWTDLNSLNYGMRSTIDMNFLLKEGHALSGVTGVELQMQNGHTIGYSMVPDSFNLAGYNIIGPMTSNKQTISGTASVFSEWTLNFPQEFSVTAGIGWSGLGIELDDRFYLASNNNPSNPNVVHKPTKYKNSFDNMFSPRIALNKVFSKAISVYASYSSAYKAPVSSYFFIPQTGQIVAGLKPETGSQIEVGTKGNLPDEKLSYQLAVFNTVYSNKLTAVAVPDATNSSKAYSYMVNGGRQNHWGIEGQLRGDVYRSAGFVKSLVPFVNFTYSNFKYGKFLFQKLSTDKKTAETVDYSNKVVVGTPPFMFNVGFDLWTNPGLYFNTTFSHRDKMYYTSDNLHQTDDYELLNAKAGYSKSFAGHYGVDVFLGLNNITAHKNYAMVFMNQPSLNAYLAAPYKMNYFGGVNLKYIF